MTPPLVMTGLEPVIRAAPIQGRMGLNPTAVDALQRARLQMVMW